MVDQLKRASGVSECDLTICTVVFRDKWCLDLNWQLTSQLNDSRNFVWLVVRNKPIQSEDWSRDTIDRYQIVEGMEPDTDPDHRERHGSYQHAAGLDLATQHIATHFALFLDADCFVVRPNWIQDIVRYMLGRDLAFWGLPYHPWYFSKIRYFPCGVCLFVDTNRVKLSEFDWTPEASGFVPQTVRFSLFERLLRRVFVRLGMGKRLSIGVSQDTGIRIYRNYIGRTDIKYEYAIPVFKPADLGINIKHLAMERFLPDRYCFVPKRRGYFTDGGFAASGFPDVVSMGCEEYMWQGDPFAFHVRGRYNELKNDRRLLTDVVMSFSDLVPPKSPISSCESVEFPAC